MFAQILNILLLGFIAFTACDYTLGSFIQNTKAVVVSSAIFAVLVVLFARSFVL